MGVTSPFCHVGHQAAQGLPLPTGPSGQPRMRVWGVGWLQDAYGILIHLFNKYLMNTSMCLTELSSTHLEIHLWTAPKLDIDSRGWMGLSGQRSKEG